MIWIVRLIGIAWTLFVGIPGIYFVAMHEWNHAFGSLALVLMGSAFWHTYEVHYRDKKR